MACIITFRPQALIEISSFTAESIPKKPLERIDYVVATVDMTQAYSLTLLDQTLHHMQDRFLTNKMAVVVTKSKLGGIGGPQATTPTHPSMDSGQTQPVAV